MTLFINRDVDLYSENYVYTKFGKILSIHSKDLKQKPNFDINRGL